MIFIAQAMAQDMVLPVVPVVGIDPIVQWLMGMASVVVAGLFPLLVLFLKQKFNNDKADADRAKIDSDGAKIAAAAQNGAALGAKIASTQQDAITVGVNYIKAGVPDAVAATPQATDEHLANMVSANLGPVVIRTASGQFARDTAVITPVKAPAT